MKNDVIFFVTLAPLLLLFPSSALALRQVYCPPAPVCYFGGADGSSCEYYPLGAGTACNKPVGGACNGDGVCSVTATGTLTPNFIITQVLYAPPGAQSTVTYNSGTTLGSTTTGTYSFTTATANTIATSGGIFGTGAGITVGWGSSFGNTNTESTDISVVLTQGLPINGVTDIINHNYDQIWFLSNPTLQATYVETTAGTAVTYGFAPNQSLEPYYLLVGELNGTIPLSSGVQAFLSSQGITSAEFPQLLAADPFANGGIYLDPNRFTQVGSSILFEPEIAGQTKDNCPPFNYSVTETNSEQDTSSVTYDTSLKVSGSVGFFSLFDVTATSTATWTWNSQTSLKNTTSSTSTAAISICQPASTYTGGTVVRAYFDKIWKTFAFVVSTD